MVLHKYISLLLTSFPTLGTGFQLCLREYFHAAQSSFPCGSEHFSLRVRALSMRVRALSMRLRNQAFKTKCQHSSSLMSSIKKRVSRIFERVPLAKPVFERGASRIADQRSSYWAFERWLKKEGLLVQVLIWFAIFLTASYQGSPISFFILLFELGLCIQSNLLENSRPTACYF